MVDAIVKIMDRDESVVLMEFEGLIRPEARALMWRLNKAYDDACAFQKAPTDQNSQVAKESARKLLQSLMLEFETRKIRLEQTRHDEATQAKTIEEKVIQIVQESAPRKVGVVAVKLAAMTPQDTILKLGCIDTCPLILSVLGVPETSMKPIRKPTGGPLTIHLQTEGLSFGCAYTKRNATCLELFKFVTEHCVTLVRAPPYSGKTSLSQLFSLLLQEKRWEVELVTLLGKPPSMPLDSFLAEWTEKVTRASSLDNNREQPFVLILDEVQIAYDDPNSAFWALIKQLKNCQPEDLKVRIVLFAASGEFQGYCQSSRYTPVHFEDCHLDAKFLLFRKEEFDEFVANNVRWKCENTRAVPNLFFSVFHEFNCSVEEEEAIIRFLSNLVMNPSSVGSTSLPGVLMSQLLKTGVIYSQSGDSSAKFAFASPLIESIYIRKLLEIPNLRVVDPTSLKELLLKAISSLDEDGYPCESCYVSELYRALVMHLPTNIYVSSNVGCFGTHGTGYIDLFADKVKWGIEVLREGTEGAYQILKLRDWFAVDFRCKAPDYIPKDEHMMTVHFAADFSSAEVTTKGDTQCIPISGTRTLHHSLRYL
ncbi:hypothetical protein Pelo_6802 [Pelomyxa schiedti]|nr:hypothetical protein Pelo_6802 [Pelomyxa schiedti]